MSPRTPRTTISFELPQDMKEDLDEELEGLGITKSTFYRTLTADWLKAEEDNPNSGLIAYDVQVRGPVFQLPRPFVDIEVKKAKDDLKEVEEGEEK